MKAVYDNLLMIYYSGTGNSKRVSEWIAESASEAGMRTCVTSFNDFRAEMLNAFTGKTLIGFFSATHGFNMPHSMLKFLIRFSVLRGSDVFIGNTRAGMKLSKLFLPGLSGMAMYFPALILLLKGYKVRSLYPVDLPSNWISLHPGLRTKVIDSMFMHYRLLCRQFADKVLAGKRVLLKAFVLLPLDILVIPLAAGYYLAGRFILAKTFITNEKCNNCGLCMQQCPTKSIIPVHGKPFWKLSCESCMKCMNFCPERAIETAHTFFFVILLAMSWLVNPYLSDFVMRLTHEILHLPQAAANIMYPVIKWGTMILVFTLAYRLLHFLNRYTFFGRLISYTSFTYWKYWRRYRAPAAHAES